MWCFLSASNLYMGIGVFPLQMFLADHTPLLTAACWFLVAQLGHFLFCSLWWVGYVIPYISSERHFGVENKCRSRFLVILNKQEYDACGEYWGSFSTPCSEDLTKVLCLLWKPLSKPLSSDGGVPVAGQCRCFGALWETVHWRFVFIS